MKEHSTNKVVVPKKEKSHLNLIHSLDPTTDLQKTQSAEHVLKTTTREAVHSVGYTTEKMMQFLQQTHCKKKEQSRNLQIKKYLRAILPNFYVRLLLEP